MGGQSNDGVGGSETEGWESYRLWRIYRKRCRDWMMTGRVCWRFVKMKAYAVVVLHMICGGEEFKC